MPSVYPIEESALKDLISFITKHKSERRNDNALRQSSIARATKNLIFSFPVLCSDSVSPQTAGMINKAIERNCTSMLQMLLLSKHLEGWDGADVISKFHTNMGTTMDLTDYIDRAAGLLDDVNDAKNLIHAFHNSGEIEYKTDDDILNELAQAFKESWNEFYENDFSDNPVSKYYIAEDYRGYHVKFISERADSVGDAADDLNDKAKRARHEEEDRQFNRSTRNAELYMQYQKMQNDQMKNNSDYRLSREEINNRKEQNRIQNANNDRQFKLALANRRSEYITRQLLPQDAQKANELQPTLMVIRFAIPETQSNGMEITQEFVAGVKAHLTPIPSADIIDQIGKYNGRQINDLNYIRATTGEIKLSQDFIAAVKDAKLDAKKDSLSTTSPIWRMLQSRANSSRVRTLARARNSASAITTLVITQQEVELIKMNYNIDMSNPAVAMRFMNSYNLLCLVIVDDSTDTARFLFDGERFFTTYAYNSLERENRNGLSDRTVLNLISNRN